MLLYSNNRGETLGVFLPQSYFPCISDVCVLEEEKGMNLCYRYIYILQLTVQILIDNYITKPTIRQHCIMVQSIHIYPLLSYPSTFTGQQWLHLAMYNGLYKFNDTTIWNHKVPDVFERVHSNTVTGQTFSVRCVERFRFLNVLLLYWAKTGKCNKTKLRQRENIPSRL